MDINKLGGYLATLHNAKSTEFTAKLYKNAEKGELKSDDEIFEAIKELVEGHWESVAEHARQEISKEKVSEGKRLKGEATEAYFRKKVKGFESKKIGEEFYDDLIAHLSKQAEPETKIVEQELTLSKLKEYASQAGENAVKALIAEVDAEAKKEADAAKKALDDYKLNVERESKAKIIKEANRKALLQLRAKIGTTPEQQEKLIELFNATIDVDKFQVDGSDVIPLGPDGNPLPGERKFTHMSHLEWVKANNPFGTHEVDPDKNSPPAPSIVGSKSAKYTFKDLSDFMEQRKTADPETRKAMTESWKIQQERQAA